MAPNTRQNSGFDQNVANETVRESLGLSADDLGMNNADDYFNADGNNQDNDHDDLTGDDEDLNLRDRGRQQDNNNDDNEPLFQEPRQQQDDLQLRQPQQPVPQQQPGRIPPAAEIKADAKGNLVDKRTGQIVAKAGSEARMYQKLHRTTQAYSHLQAQHNDVETRLNKAVEIGTQLFEKLKEAQNNQNEWAPEKHGLQPHEAREALTFAKEAKADPVGTIKKLLTRAAANGIDLTTIGLAGGNFDPKSLIDLVRQEIGTATEPLRQRTQRESQQEQADREARERTEATKTELTTFLTANPDAKEYLPIFHQVYSNPKFQHMSLGEVWARLQLNLMRRPQQQQQPRTPSNQRPANRNQRPPNGRNLPPRGPAPGEELAPVSMSYEDIVRGLM